MATSATVPEVPTGIAPAATGSGGVAGSRPVTPRNHAKASATAIGAAEARIHHTHGPTGSWRRRTRAKPSTATSIGASSREAISSRTAHRGSTLRSVTSERVEPPSCRVGVLSSAVSVRRAARPKGCSRDGLRTIGSSAGGERSPLTDISAVGSVVGHQRALLAHRDREGQASPLRRRARAARVGAGLLAHRGLDGAAQLQRTDPVPRRPAGDERPAHGRPRDVAEHEDRPGAAGEALGEVARAPEPGAAAAGGDEGHGALQTPAAHHAGQLHHGRGARQLGARAAAQRVAMGHHHEAGARLADLARDDRGQAAPAVGRLGLERRRADLVGAHGTEGGGQLGGQRRVAAVARAARRIGAGPRVEVGLRARGREGVGLERGPDGPGTVAERERAHDQREEDRDEGCAVDPRVEHANSAG